MDLMFAPLRKYADFDGRARRTEYWLFTLLNVMVLGGIVAVALTADSLMADYAHSPAPILVAVALFGWLLGTLIPGIAVTVRRLHDINLAGAWFLVTFLPFGGLALLVMTLMDGTPTRNKYGRDPKGRGQAEAAAASVFD